MHRNCPLENESARPYYNLQEAKTMGQVARAIPRIYTTLKDWKEYHQLNVVEVVGNIV